MIPPAASGSWPPWQPFPADTAFAMDPALHASGLTWVDGGVGDTPELRQQHYQEQVSGYTRKLAMIGGVAALGGLLFGGTGLVLGAGAGALGLFKLATGLEGFPDGTPSCRAPCPPDPPEGTPMGFGPDASGAATVPIYAPAPRADTGVCPVPCPLTVHNVVAYLTPPAAKDDPNNPDPHYVVGSFARMR